MRTRWVNFARHGKPAGEPDWPSYDDADRACLVINRTDSVARDLDGHLRAAWGGEVVGFR
ncbi:hypothetical protein NIIDMKKI_13760 [Mycobacterium kansasii]|uniref:Uncharacterized protein n=1 Tax=Mycobacterium kansasii TaxID=1768 RepID=A0A7G1I594_MYCKA|nr:hypothetical protein NIIDMKKI_13760 [Mycobacterium kansasii]